MANYSLLTTLNKLFRNQLPINFKGLIGLKITSNGATHISLGLDWVFTSLSHNSLSTLYTLHKSISKFHDRVYC